MCELNPTYNEMAANRDYFNHDFTFLKKFNPRLNNRIKSTQETHFKDRGHFYLEENRIHRPQTITNSLFLMPVKEESNILKTEIFKSKISNIMESSKISTDNNFKNMIIHNSPSHMRAISPTLKPKGTFDNFEKISPEINRNLKETEHNLPVTLSIIEFFKINFKQIFQRPLSSKEKLFLISTKKFRKETDICRILEKIQEFEKFKMVFLNPDQQVIFNLLAKPLIYLESQEERVQNRTSYFLGRPVDEDFTIKNDAKRRINELKKHYKKLSGKNNLSSVDQNLLKLIEEDIFE